MSKITRDDIIGPTGLGFTKELFSAIATTEEAFNTLVDAVIAGQASDLSDRITSTVYNDAERLNYVKKAEKCLTAAELIQRRINIILANIQASGNEIGTTVETRQRKEYLDQAEVWIAKLAAGVTSDSPTDFSCNVITSNRFDTSSE